MSVVQIFDNGTAFSPSVLDVDEQELIARFMTGIKTIAALKYPTLVSVSRSLINAYKNLLTVSLAAEYAFEGSEKVKEYLANPDAFAVAEVAPAASAAPAAEKAEEPAEESDEDMGFSLFD
ncbi:acidic ribosomal protein 0 [Mycena sanguinolenta]|nr:acidic ribosomal protein 0 [Mycena sanguinolenta]